MIENKFYIAVITTSAVLVAVFAILAAVFMFKWKQKKQVPSNENRDLELQQLSLSVRTTSDKKVSFEGSQTTLDTTPRKFSIEIFSIQELRKATDDFNTGNLIEGSVFHGRFNGQDLAIKRVVRHEKMSNFDFDFFQRFHSPNILRLLGTTTLTENSESYLIFEYAKNGSLKDWLHGGLALKSHFIASCNCFLTWKQRLKMS